MKLEGTTPETQAAVDDLWATHGKNGVPPLPVVSEEETIPAVVAPTGEAGTKRKRGRPRKPQVPGKEVPITRAVGEVDDMWATHEKNGVPPLPVAGVAPTGEAGTNRRRGRSRKPQVPGAQSSIWNDLAWLHLEFHAQELSLCVAARDDVRFRRYLQFFADMSRNIDVTHA